MLRNKVILVLAVLLLLVVVVTNPSIHKILALSEFDTDYMLADISKIDNLLASRCECVDYIKNRYGLTGSIGVNGGARYMGAYLEARGFVRVSEPQVGAVVVFQPAFGPGINQTYGHVAVITSVISQDNRWKISVRGARQNEDSLGRPKPDVLVVTENNCNNVNTTSLAAYLKTWGTDRLAYYVYNPDRDDNRSLSSGVQTSGTISPKSDKDTYYFNGTAGQLLTLTMNKASGSNLDSFVEIFYPDNSSTRIAYNDDDGGNYNSLIRDFRLSQTGRYKVVASSYSQRTTGAYSLTVALRNGDTDDNRTLGNGGSLSGTINPNNDQDTYYFDGTAGQRLTLSMNRTSGGLDPWLDLYDPNGTKIKDDDDSGEGNNSLISNFTLPRTGRYRIVAHSYHNGSNGGYSIRLSLQSASITCSGSYKAEYFSNRGLTGSPVYQRCENWPINWDWGSGSPGNGVPTNSFSARWTGTANFSSGSYTFIATADDGIRVWLDNTLIINEWRDQGAREFRTTRSVSGGNHTIRIEYYENGGGAVAKFRWETASSGSSGSNSNLALGRSAYSSSNESSSFLPGKANDGNNSTRWSSQISSNLGAQWWWTTFSSPQSINQIVINWEAAYASAYRVYWYSDSSCQNVISSASRTRSSAGTDTVNISLASVRCVAVYMTQRAPRMNNYSIWEVSIYRR